MINLKILSSKTANRNNVISTERSHERSLNLELNVEAC